MSSFYRNPWEGEEKKKRSYFYAGERAGLILCLMMLLFSISERDIPLGFFSLSYIIFFLAKLVKAFQIISSRATTLANFLQGAGAALFIGSLLMLIFI